MQDTRPDENSKEAVEKVLGEPVFDGLSENALRVRRNLLIFGLTALFITCTDVGIAPQLSGSLMGIGFTGVEIKHLKIVLLILNGYFLFHFGWCLYDAFYEWRLRVTGTKLAFLTGAGTWGSSDTDHPTDPRQSTLYYWWIKHSRNLKNMHKKLDEISESIEESKSEINAYLGQKRVLHDGDITKINKKLDSELSQLSNIKAAVEQSKRDINSPRITVSLERFDNWFKHFLKSRNLRWIVIDAALPLIVNIVAMVALVSSFSAHATGLSGKVISVTDGDTVKILTEGKKQERIRLAGINAPERKQPYGQKSKQYLSEMVLGITRPTKKINQ